MITECDILECSYKTECDILECSYNNLGYCDSSAEECDNIQDEELEEEW